MAISSPSIYEVRRSEQKQQKYSDCLSLTCQNLGQKLLELSQLQAEVSFTRNDLIGYYQLQYGTDSYSIGKTIDMALSKSNIWEGWDPARYLIERLPNIIKPNMTPAVLNKILLGSPFGYSASIDIGELEGFMEKRQGIDANSRPYTSLEPKENTTVLYKGRMIQEIGMVQVHSSMAYVSMSVDLVSLENESTTKNIMIASKEEDNYHGGSFVQSIRML